MKKIIFNSGFINNYLLMLLIILCSVTTYSQTEYLLNINRLSLPFKNDGVIADVTNSTGGRLDDKHFLFSAGFLLAGKFGNEIFATGVASASRIADYLPGNVDSNSTNPNYKIYVILKDPAFNSSWMDYRNAVVRGADFYDGNGDGIYNPIDLNGNGQWDINEDRPDILGDITTWCVYNDSKPANQRRFSDVNPLGIEIHQTLWAYATNNPNDSRSVTFFVRYKLINKGKVAQTLDSVFFAGWSDTDLGAASDAYLDDLAGCDTIHNSGYIYNDGDDPDWGVNPPAHFIKVLQGPYAYIPGITFIDNNFNGEYDDGIDTPLDTAYNYRGSVLGKTIIPGAKNMGMYAYVQTMPSHPMQGGPSNKMSAWYYLQGKNIFGQPISACSFPFGTVLGGINCNLVNPRYMYSGDPVTGTGWINTQPTDQRQIVSTGPFKLRVGKPVNIILAHIVGRGNSALNSITVSRAYSSAIEQFL
ncbi:MAG: hypothetical protein N2043_00710, partial [Ignavibacterium sp.]|nr:hypothetical protein [Ignavibacterium sp.]